MYGANNQTHLKQSVVVGQTSAQQANAWNPDSAGPVIARLQLKFEWLG